MSSTSTVTWDLRVRIIYLFIHVKYKTVAIFVMFRYKMFFEIYVNLIH